MYIRDAKNKQNSDEDLEYSKSYVDNDFYQDIIKTIKSEVKSVLSYELKVLPMASCLHLLYFDLKIIYVA